MSSPPLVSAVIIVYNGERFLEEAIRSVFAQSHADWELLLVDDGYVSRAKLAGILATLKKHKVKGTFLFVGSWSRANPWAAQMVRAGGHRLGNHSNTDPSLSDLSGAALNSQIRYGVRGTGSPRFAASYSSTFPKMATASCSG